MRILPAGGSSCHQPSCHPSHYWAHPANCGQQRSCSKQGSRNYKGSKGSSTRDARRLQDPWLCNPFHLQCASERAAGGRQGRSHSEGAVAQGKAAGRVRPEGRRTLAPPLGGNGIVCYKNGGKIQATINHLMHMCVLTVCACTLPCFAHACFRVLHILQTCPKEHALSLSASASSMDAQSSDGREGQGGGL